MDLSEFNRELKEKFGTNFYGEQIVRCVWGGGEREIKSDGHTGLKYFRVFKRPSILYGVPVRTEELGIPRFIVERLVPPDKLSSAERERFPQGRYAYYYEVETIQGKFRPPGGDTIQHIVECLAGEEEYQRELDRTLAAMKREEEEDCERNASGENVPFNQPQLISA
jgi:hypothetical protein